MLFYTWSKIYNDDDDSDQMSDLLLIFFNCKLKPKEYEKKNLKFVSKGFRK